MKTIKILNIGRYEVKKSLFLSYAVPICEFEELHEKLKIEHHKAAHIVWAYRYLNEFLQIVENSNDDGEPKGTSGQPVLNVLRGFELINSAIAVVRYFGGIKLGTGGLVRAYSAAAKSALEESNFQKYENKERFIFSSKYQFVQKIEYFLNKIDVTFSDRIFNSEDVTWNVNITKEQKEKLVDFLNKSAALFQ